MITSNNLDDMQYFIHLHCSFQFGYCFCFDNAKVDIHFSFLPFFQIVEKELRDEKSIKAQPKSALMPKSARASKMSSFLQGLPCFPGKWRRKLSCETTMRAMDRPPQGGAPGQCKEITYIHGRFMISTRNKSLHVTQSVWIGNTSIIDIRKLDAAVTCFRCMLKWWDAGHEAIQSESK